MKLKRWLWALALGCAIGDVLTTTYIFAHGGHELNPLSGVFTGNGVLGLVLGKLVPFSVIGSMEFSVKGRMVVVPLLLYVLAVGEFALVNNLLAVLHP